MNINSRYIIIVVSNENTGIGVIRYSRNNADSALKAMENECSYESTIQATVLDTLTGEAITKQGDYRNLIHQDKAEEVYFGSEKTTLIS